MRLMASTFVALLALVTLALKAFIEWRLNESDADDSALRSTEH